jgi:hypothetical protein
MTVCEGVLFCLKTDFEKGYVRLRMEVIAKGGKCILKDAKKVKAIFKMSLGRSGSKTPKEELF